MYKNVLIAGMTAVLGLGALSLPTGASAQSYDSACRKSNSAQNTEGTVVGGVAGAVIGGAVSGHRQKTQGAILGGLAGALVGNSIARANEHPCPPGFEYAPPPPPPPPPPRYVGPPPGDFWYGAPEDPHERMEVLRRRIDADNRDGILSPREFAHLNDRLDDIRRQERDMRERSGGRLFPEERDILFRRLNDLSRRLQQVERAY
jgi:Glycine zipper 2TM domain